MVNGTCGGKSSWILNPDPSGHQMSSSSSDELSSHLELPSEFLLDNYIQTITHFPNSLCDAFLKCCHQGALFLFYAWFKTGNERTLGAHTNPSNQQICVKTSAISSCWSTGCFSGGRAQEAWQGVLRLARFATFRIKLQQDVTTPRV